LQGYELTETDPDYFLIRLAGQGDMNAYRKLMGRYTDYCVRFAERMIGNRADAEDVTQDVSLKVWKEAAKWKPQAKFSTWLYRVMFNACIDHKRKIVPIAAGDFINSFEGVSSPERDLQEKQTAKKVSAALQRLPERQRAALVLSYYEEIKNQEAAEAMDLDLGAFQSLLYRARQSLKEQLLDYRVEEKNG
jgi:RNA polymerase sigma-70 factor (ECF subfamily)